MMSSFYMIAVSVILELADSSPVYNLQPAYITTNIGSTGRNIRHLPCISRKTNQSGVCMFAIDCLKSNGTHLGTCIDRFYFGSCCHVSTMVKISENTIDASIIPNREPPHRISSTVTTTGNAAQVDVESVSKKNTVPNTNTSVKPTKYWLTTLRQPINGSISENMNNNIFNNSKTSNSNLFSTNSPNYTSNYSSSSSSHSSNSTSIISSSFVNQIIHTEATIFELGTAFLDDVKFSTFQSVENNDIANTLRPSFSTFPPEKIHKPVTLIPSKPKPAITAATPSPDLYSKPIILSSLIPHRSSISPFPQTLESANPENTKPLKATKKPSRITTKPYKINKVTQKPFPVQPHKRFTVITKLPGTTTMPHSSSFFNTTNTSSIKEVTTINLNTIWPTATRAPSPYYNPKPIKVSLVNTTKGTTVTMDETTQLPNEIIVNELLNGTSFLETASGNSATNEIDSSDSTSKLGIAALQPSLLTSNFTKATTKPSLIISQTSYEETGISANVTDSDPNTWQPVTTPDGWVLLPSISTVTESTSSTPTSTSDAMMFTDIPTPNKVIMTTNDDIDNITNSSTPAPVDNKLELVLTTVHDIVNAITNASRADNITATTEGYSSSAIANISQSTTSNNEELSNPVNMSDFTDVCGRRMHPEARIVGGEKSTFGRWPWQISLRQWRTSTYLHKCGAALLNENWAITAAHCVDNVPPSDLLLRLGEHDLSTESEPYLHQERRVQIVASHPQFDPRTFEYDLALLRFYEPVTFQPNILPVCIPQTDKTFIGRTAHVTGWGRLYEDGPLPSVLQEVSVPVINNTVCESMYRAAGYIEHIPYIFICAGWRRGGFDSCEGDSGGPMVIQREDKRFLLAGIISWGIGCAEPNQPGVYTRISEFRDWINQILQF